MKIGFVGTGNMGQAILKGLINSGFSKMLPITIQLEEKFSLVKETESYFLLNLLHI